MRAITLALQIGVQGAGAQRGRRCWQGRLHSAGRRSRFIPRAPTGAGAECRRRWSMSKLIPAEAPFHAAEGNHDLHIVPPPRAFRTKPWPYSQSALAGRTRQSADPGDCRRADNTRGRFAGSKSASTTICCAWSTRTSRRRGIGLQDRKRRYTDHLRDNA